MAYQPDAAFTGLFHAFTGHERSIGRALTQLMIERSSGDPLLVSTASDIAFFPGGGAPARIESFRKSTRGFIEFTAVSHTPLAVAYLARMRELDPAGDAWREQARKLIERAECARTSNRESMWREHVSLRAFDGLEPKIVRMVDYTLAASIDYLQRALEDPRLLEFDTLRTCYLEATSSDAGTLPVPMNDVMFATFCLAYVDIAWRIGNWLRDARIDWPNAMVLVSGQSGRPTAGVTWSSNNMCHLIWRASDEALVPERLYVAPHAPGFSVAALPDANGLAALEQTYRGIWCNTRASVELSRSMFAGTDAWQYMPSTASDMPPIPSTGNRDACTARLRRIMEDPQQLLSNCVADYVVDELGKNGNRPECVPVPGFSNVEY